MSFRNEQLGASQATAVFEALFTEVFGQMLGQIVRKVVRTCTRSETRWPNDRPNSNGDANARFAERSLATPPPLFTMAKVVRCSPIPPPNDWMEGSGSTFNLRVQKRGAGWPTTRVETGIG